MTRCSWAQSPSEEYVKYHDEEWGVPLHDDQKLFEFLILEGAQAGLSWSTILKRREGYRKAFDGFEVTKVATYDQEKKEQLLQDTGIIRNRLKIESAVTNARAFLEISGKHGTFDQFIWSFVDGKPIVNAWKSMKEVPAKTALSDQISKQLKNLGFSFVGSTIIYAFMQATGMVNDHTVDCFRYEELK